VSNTRPPFPVGGAVLVARVLLGGLFIFAAVMKLRDVQGFAFAVQAFDIIPKNANHVSQLLAFVVPWTELVLGICLVLGLWVRAASLLLSILLLAFIAGLASVLIRQMNITCECFGRFEFPCKGQVSPCHIIRNCVLLAVTLFVLWKGPGSLAVDRQSTN